MGILFWKKPEFTPEELQLMEGLAEKGKDKGLRPAGSLSEKPVDTRTPAEKLMGGGVVDPSKLGVRDPVGRMRAEQAEKHLRDNREKELRDHGVGASEAKAQAWREDNERRHADSRTWQKLRHPDKK